MKVRFWGVRGSIPTPGPKTVKYGGNTSCIEVVTAAGDLMIFDAGTGIRELGMAVVKRQHKGKINIFLSHTHWDHINGFPFFAPAYIPGTEILIYAPCHYEKTVADVMRAQMDYAYFPVSATQLLANITYKDIREETIAVGAAKVSSFYTNHPVSSLGYRVEADGKSLVYTGDHEKFFDFLTTGNRNDTDFIEVDAVVKEQNAKIVGFCKGVDLLIADAQYTGEEYKSKRGYGHSALEDTLELALGARVRRLALFHHEPTHDDGDLDRMEEDARRKLANASPGIEVFMAREGMAVDV